MISRISFLLIFSLLIVSFSVSKKNGVKLISASSESWVSGIKGGNKGTEYYFKIKILTSDKIEFDSLWIKNKIFKTYLANPSKAISSSPVTFSKNDTITVRVSDLINSNTSQTIQPSLPPKKFKGEALLRYYINGKANYLIIKKINIIQNINRP